MKPLFLTLHRWLTLIFSIPLAIIILTGLILSFEPLATSNAIKPGTVTVDAMAAAVEKFDPDAKARMLVLEAGTANLRIIGAGAPQKIDLANGEVVREAQGGTSLFRISRQLHEGFLVHAEWLVILSTIVMLLLIFFGILMGLPTIRNTIAGWHKGIAWGLLPFLILSPLTGLGIAFGISLSQTPPAIEGSPASMAEAVRIVGKEHDLSSLIWLRKFGNKIRARIVENGAYELYSVTPSTTVLEPRNWSRSLHEGNWYGAAPAIVNVIISLALIALMGTGLYAWGRRELQIRHNRVARQRAA